MTKRTIKPAEGKLGVLLPGMGAVTSTFIAGVELMKKGLAAPKGSLTQLQRIRLGKRYENRNPRISEFVPLAQLSNLVFGGWDIFEDSVWEAALKAGVLPETRLAPVKKELEAIVPMPAVFDQSYVVNLKARQQKTGKNKMDLAEQLMKDIELFKKSNGCDRLVMVWCGSTEVHMEKTAVHETLEAFEQGLRDDSKDIPSSSIYAYAAIKSGVPYVNGAPNLSADFPALVELAEKNGVPIAGKDFKTGQTMMKTVLAPAFKTRMLGLEGWYSTNILGNRDGEVLDDPGSFRSKEKTKTSVLDACLDTAKYPDLYGHYFHKVRIEYYPPRGDEKEGWDNIDITGWLDMPMQIKVNFLCRDSILAAPIVLDLVLFMDLAGRSGLKGIQEWLSFYFKAPQARPDLSPEHDLFVQHMKLTNTLRILMGEEVIDHSGLDYYDPELGTAGAAEAPKPYVKGEKAKA
ncbi:MAG: inositol-3-phosphate synthase [Elusimicrobia bacterium CG1_02_63_36]|nr:MAG: inositol-3-phosphate synthase [Elusimicrobia bacterium CG1_02_63_36]PIP82072.1 MAG: inositol-3-phosphate synthase [Elusimicrobia bacterium CG22_combo_CG10-13_8_21_14_all_63_91]PJA16309.1 MAG: inositol-3-phosphate synthase [Elusimicrobia bacterium CG_4_10_14_0_2_um_filter_63_34]PJB26923.1 MAG: inositol-3-phosphate synthase [Elusimicrobia bacterium CG_4_9_14_3_um_filter_62_55]